MSDQNLKWLETRILDFMSVIENCLNSSTYADDRPIYTKDLAEAAKWLLKLHRKIPPTEVASEITSSSTSKFFGDYWRQGQWGDMESQALSDLQASTKKHFNL